MSLRERFLLTPDLMMLVFDHMEARDLQRTAHTCHRWRGWAVAHPRCLWTLRLQYLRTDRPVLLAADVISRFQKAVELAATSILELKLHLALEIAIHPPGSAPSHWIGQLGSSINGVGRTVDLFYDTVPQLIRQMSARAWRITIWCNREVRPTILAALPSAPLARTLSLSLGQHHPNESPIPLTLFGGDAPFLRQVELHNTPLPKAPVRAFQHVTAVSFMQEPTSIRVKGAQSVEAASLLACPELQSVHIFAGSLTGDNTMQACLIARLTSLFLPLPFANGAACHKVLDVVTRLLAVPNLCFSVPDWTADTDEVALALAAAAGKPISLSHLSCNMLVNGQHESKKIDSGGSTKARFNAHLGGIQHQTWRPSLDTTCCYNVQSFAAVLYSLDVHLSEIHTFTHATERLQFPKLVEVHVRLSRSEPDLCRHCRRSGITGPHPPMCPRLELVKLSYSPLCSSHTVGSASVGTLDLTSANYALGCIATKTPRIPLTLQYNFFAEDDVRFRPLHAWHATNLGPGRTLDVEIGRFIWADLDNLAMWSVNS